MSVVFLILKIIGIVLLVLVCLVVLVLAVVLCVPIRYRVAFHAGEDENAGDGSADETENHFLEQVQASARVTWLLHLVRFTAAYEGGRPKIQLGIAWHRKNFLGEEEEPETMEPESVESKTASQKESTAEDNSVGSEPQSHVHTATPVSESLKDENRELIDEEAAGAQAARQAMAQQSEHHSQQMKREVGQQSEHTEQKTQQSQDGQSQQTKQDDRQHQTEQQDVRHIDPSTEQEQPGRFTRMKERLVSIPEQLRARKTRIKESWKDKKLFLKKVKKMLDDERNHAAITFLKQQLVVLVHRIRPKKIRADLQFSAGKPDATGELVGLCALFPFTMQKGVVLAPDFTADAAYVQGDAELRGSIYLIGIVIIALRIFLNKDCRRMYRMIKHYFL